MPSSKTPNSVAPQVYQGYGGGQTWTTIKAVAGHQRGASVLGLLYWHGEDMTALESGSEKAVLMVGPGGAVTSLPLPNGSDLNNDAVGPDGNLWVTRLFGPIESVTLTGVITQYSLPRQNTDAANITAGPDGALWFGEDGGTDPELGRISTAGAITEYAYPTGVTQLPGLVSGSDGNLWATDDQGHVYKISTSGVFTTYSLGVTENEDLVEDGGDVWTLTHGNLVSVDPAGTQAAYPPPNGFDTNVGVGPDGNLWALEDGANSSLVTFNVTTHEFLTVAPPPPSFFQGGQFMPGPDGNLWTDSCCNTSLLVYLWHSMSVSPTSLTIAAPGDQAPLNVTETNYNGNWSGSSSDKSVAIIARSQTVGTLTVTAVGVGSCVLTIGDADHNRVKIKVTVN